MNEITISAIITTCNRPVSILERAVRSAVMQKRVPDELIIIDDSSETGTHSEEVTRMLSKYAGKTDLHYLKNMGCKGACYSRNRGIETAVGEYIAFLDDDDEWTEDKLMLQEKKALEHKDAVLITGYIRVITEGSKRTRIYNRGWEYEGCVLPYILGNNFVGGCSTPLIKRSAAIKCGCFDESFASSQDYDLWIRLAEAGEFAFVKEILVDYHLHPGNITEDFDRRLTGWKRIYGKYRKAFGRYPEARGKFFELLAVNAWENGRYYFSVGMLGRSVRAGGMKVDFIRTVMKMGRITVKHALNRLMFKPE